MTDYTRIRNTLMSNPQGILESVMSFGLQDKIKSNIRLYFYRYNVYDLVEIEFKNNLICVYDFKHTEDRAIKIYDDLDFYSNYFKIAGLEDKRFLFDLALGLPVNYKDFIEMNKIKYIDNKEIAFVLDRKNGYLTEKSSVYIFMHTERAYYIDKCILSYINNSIVTTDPKSLRLSGCINSIITSGLLNGVDYKDIEKQLDVIDLNSKFMGTINSLNFNSDHVKNLESKLKVDKFKRILQGTKLDNINTEIVKQEHLKGEVSLREIIDHGLDGFMKVIKKQLRTNKDAMRVLIDCEYQTIRSAYIVKEVMFITPVTLLPISYFKELLDSDNVEYILN